MKATFSIPEIFRPEVEALEALLNRDLSGLEDPFNTGIRSIRISGLSGPTPKKKYCYLIATSAIVLALIEREVPVITI